MAELHTRQSSAGGERGSPCAVKEVWLELALDRESEGCFQAPCARDGVTPARRAACCVCWQLVSWQCLA